MHFALIPEYLEFFHKHHYIEFDSLIRENEATLLAKMTKQVIATKLKTRDRSLSQATAADFFLAGRDSWRANQDIKKIVLRSQLAQIAAELSKQQKLRIAYDQVFIGASLSSTTTDNYLPPSLFSPMPLNDSSCIQGIVAALILQLSPVASTAVATKTSTPFAPHPQAQGNGIFFLPTLPISLEYLQDKHQSMHQLLIVYSSSKSIYKREDRDPHTHDLKKMGYIFGDRLTQATHPIVNNSIP